MTGSGRLVVSESYIAAKGGFPEGGAGYLFQKVKKVGRKIDSIV
jgi:hypothetical protein